MSGDYFLATHEGSTLVRISSAIFVRDLTHPSSNNGEIDGMSFFSELSRKLGFTSVSEESEELEDGNLLEEEEEEEEEGDAERTTAHIKNTFRSLKQDERAIDEETNEQDEPLQHGNVRRGNIIHDERMEARSRQNRVESSQETYMHCERIVRVRQIEECREIIRFLLQGESVLLNLENIDPKDCGRVVDLLSGAAFALQGRMIKVAHLSYLLAPKTVEIVETDQYAASRTQYR